MLEVIFAFSRNIFADERDGALNFRLDLLELDFIQRRFMVPPEKALVTKKSIYEMIIFEEK